MLARSLRVLLGFGLFMAALYGLALLHGQQAAPGTSGEGTSDLPPVPKGVEVLARGPVHEAFATPTAEPAPTKSVAKQPPKTLDELPPEEKPEGEAVWIGGYWHWDDDRNDFLWVTGIWRVQPPGKQWIAGYWREDGSNWQWVPGYWAAVAAKEEAAQQVTYLPEPPKPPDVAMPAEPPAPDTFWVPGCWEWRGSAYVWRAGYWAKVQPGYVWVPAHFRWTPGGYIYIAGYWDLAIKARGVMYAPVAVDTSVVGASFVYTPVYAVPETVVVDAFFVRPCYCHYYFGDYYAPVYREWGFESTIVYSRRHYDSVIVYERWERRSDPTWLSVQIDIYNGRSAGTLATPPRTLVQQNTIIQQNITNVTNVTTITNNTTNINTTNVKNVSNTQMLMPASKLASTKGVSMVRLDDTARTQARQQAQAIQQVAVQRTKAEAPVPGGAPKEPRVASLNVPKPQPVGPRPSPSATATRPATATTNAKPAAGPVNPNLPKSSAPTNSAIKQTGGTSTATPGARPAGTAPNGQPARPQGNQPPGNHPNAQNQKMPPTQPNRPQQQRPEQKQEKDKKKPQNQQDR
jgi:hypothetical protein